MSQTVSNGVHVANMPNYYVGTTGTYYFSGMYTAVLPMIPGIWGIIRVLRATKERTASLRSKCGSSAPTPAARPYAPAV